MTGLRERAKSLLESGRVQVVIGYEEGSAGRVRPAFVRHPTQADTLVFDDRCVQNLAVYPLKPEVRELGTAALVATPAALRAVLQLAAEHQLREGEVVVLLPTPGGLKVLESFSQMEEEAKMSFQGPSPEEKSRVEGIATLPREARWEYWQGQFSRCIKCYACRAACPLCYCSQCIVEVNQPQWIPVLPHAWGSMEWHLVRAMHLAGRCVDCKECARACPVGIPVDLLNHVLREEIASQFGTRAGLSATASYALSTFDRRDREDFIR